MTGMDALDTDFVRRQFPGIDDWAFFENAGGSLVPQTVIDRVRAYGQRDPLNEYKREAFDLFGRLLTNLRSSVTMVLSHLELRVAPGESDLAPPPRRGREHQASPGNGEDSSPFPPPPGVSPGRLGAPTLGASLWGKVGRNKPCPCGSGKKYKHCHGKVA